MGKRMANLTRKNSRASEALLEWMNQVIKNSESSRRCREYTTRRLDWVVHHTCVLLSRQLLYSDGERPSAAKACGTVSRQQPATADSSDATRAFPSVALTLRSAMHLAPSFLRTVITFDCKSAYKRQDYECTSGFS